MAVALLHRRSPGRNLVRNGGLVEGEEGGAEKSGRLLVGIELEIRMDVNDEGRADGREQAGLQEWVR